MQIKKRFSFSDVNVTGMQLSEALPKKHLRTVVLVLTFQNTDRMAFPNW